MAEPNTAIKTQFKKAMTEKFPLIRFIAVDTENFYELQGLSYSVCDSTFLANDYEEMAYEMLEDEEDYIGFFAIQKIDGMERIIASMIISKEVAMDKVNKNAPNSTDANISHLLANKTEYTEITLLCSDKQHRVVGLASVMMRVVQSQFPNIVLHVAKGEKNPNANKFYIKMGFQVIPNSIVMIYRSKDQSGGAKRKQRKTKNPPKKTKK
jgi:ribosomal protein S18 acetylase RimI-like enzyme